MSNNLLSLASEINDAPVKRDNKPCYASSTGAYRALLTRLAIEVGIYGDQKVKEKMQAVLESHLRFIQKTNS